MNPLNVLSFLNSLRPALPLGALKDADGAWLAMSNGELRRLLASKSIVINGQTDWTWKEDAPALIWQLVFFPKSKRRTTLI